jgi:hypothetical protein
MRTTKSKVVFNAPFVISEAAGQLPAGTYDIEVDEEPIFAGEYTAYRRVTTLLIVHSHGSTRTLQIEPQRLDALLQADALGAPHDATPCQ